MYCDRASYATLNTVSRQTQVRINRYSNFTRQTTELRTVLDIMFQFFKKFIYIMSAVKNSKKPIPTVVSSFEIETVLMQTTDGEI